MTNSKDRGSGVGRMACGFLGLILVACSGQNGDMPKGGGTQEGFPQFTSTSSRTETMQLETSMSESTNHSDFCRTFSEMVQQLEDDDSTAGADITAFDDQDADRAFASRWLEKSQVLIQNVPDDLVEAIEVIDAESHAILNNEPLGSPDAVADAIASLYGFWEETCG
jgi:hypothetical protein